jgi:type IV pilus assembly protein PilC
MAFFSYQAFSKDGKRVNGTIEANNSQNVREQLSSKGLYVVSVVLQDDNNILSKSFFSSLFQPKFNLKDKIFFTKQLSLLLKSGIALTDALNLMIDQSPKYLQPMITKMRDELKEGTAFANVLNYFPKSFPPLYIQLIRAGEASGQMEKVLLRLASFMEEKEEFDQAVSSAIRGPLIQLVLIFGISLFLLTTMVPKISDVLISLNKPLPDLTKIVMSISNIILNNYIMLAFFGGFIFLIYLLWSNSKSGKMILDTFKLKIPIIKHFTRVTAVVQFSQTLGLLLESGVNISEALDIVVQIVDNQILVTALKKAKDNILKQGKVTEYLQKTNLFSAVDIHLIGTGEQSGSLDSMLNQIGKYNQDDLRQFSSGLTTILNPLTMIVLAIIVGTIIAAVMGPIMGMSEI